MGPLIHIKTDVGEQVLDLEEFESRVRRGELAAHCPVCFPPLTGTGWVRADELDIFRKLHQPRRLYFARAFHLGRFPRLTAGFVVLELALYAVMSAQGPIDQDVLVRWGAKVAPLVWDLGQLWRLWTANLVHKDALHIAFNLFVLFNIGGALENVFRPLDYVCLLFAAALGTTVTSLIALPQAVTAGASGIVYGILGAAVVFGVRYRELLPSRYRRILGEATIPTVLVFLYIGFTSTGVDNWAHVGGLLTGATTALFLRPRLLQEKAATPRWFAVRLAPMALVAVAMALGGPLVASRPGALRVAGDDAFGVEAPVPWTWWRGTDRFGQVAFSNGLAGFGRASFSAQSRLTEPGRRLSGALDDYVKRELDPDERGGAVRDVVMSPAVAARVGGLAGLVAEGSYVDEGNATRTRVYFVARGDLLYELTFRWPADYPGYEALIGRMQEGIVFVEPKALREVRARALIDPTAPTLLALGETLEQLGEPGAAVAAFEEAARVEPGDGLPKARLALVLLAMGNLEAGCARAGEALRAERGVEALEAAAECRQRSQEPKEALKLVEEALVLMPSDPRLEAKARALRDAP